MRLIKFTLLLLMIYAPCANAQWLKEALAYDNLYEMPKNEVSVSLGIMEIRPFDFVFGRDYHVTSAQSSSLIDYSHYLTDGEIIGDTYDTSFELRYMRNLNKRFALGLTIGTIGEESNLLTTPSESENLASVYRSYYYLMPTLRSYWYNRKHFGIYSSVSIGLSLSHISVTDFNHEDDMIFTAGKNSVKFAGEILPIGFEFGGRHLRYFFEAKANLIGSGVMLIGIKGMF